MFSIFLFLTSLYLISLSPSLSASHTIFLLWRSHLYNYVIGSIQAVLFSQCCTMISTHSPPPFLTVFFFLSFPITFCVTATLHLLAFYCQTAKSIPNETESISAPELKALRVSFMLWCFSTTGKMSIFETRCYRSLSL